MNTKSREQRYIPALGFDFLTPFYDSAVQLTTRENVFKQELVRQIDIPENGRLLDLACGTGTLTIALKERFPSGEIYGLDGDPKILDIARRKAAERGAMMNFTEGYSTVLSYSDEFFDGVATSLFFHHLTPENKRRTLLEIRRVLKTGGVLHVADWGSPRNFLMKLASLPIRWLDGATVRDSFQGKLPELMAETGFSGIAETASFDTLFGTLRLHKAERGKD